MVSAVPGCTKLTRQRTAEGSESNAEGNDDSKGPQDSVSKCLKSVNLRKILYYNHMFKISGFKNFFTSKNYKDMISTFRSIVLFTSAI